MDVGVRRLPARFLTAYDGLLLVFIAALLWAAALRGVLTLLADHASNFGAVGLVSLLLIRPRRFGVPGATRRVVITASIVGLAAAVVELAIGSTGVNVRFLNTRDAWDVVSGLLAAGLVIVVHRRMASTQA